MFIRNEIAEIARRENSETLSLGPVLEWLGENKKRSFPADVPFFTGITIPGM
ncbi:hypothetical protein K7I13_10630 [Brucepastera parasyntrophica]|uniref:hypothetical protein n=1 Tax=Brucepastera parasyntrophica TaxID=2880008 RepID=UPI00210BA919|nr:hypothetical protein [Brucepastera parasyntrophica]ULQ58971.1 hypothetical protein K7I13_10630 [Brucepastera parasyntrophica]